jgi:hypothetical protein
VNTHAGEHENHADYSPHPKPHARAKIEKPSRVLIQVHANFANARRDHHGAGQMDLSFETVNELKIAGRPVQVSDFLGLFWIAYRRTIAVFIFGKFTIEQQRALPE